MPTIALTPKATECSRMLTVTARLREALRRAVDNRLAVGQKNQSAEGSARVIMPNTAFSTVHQRIPLGHDCERLRVAASDLRQRSKEFGF